ncbi:MAG: DUF2271 domain-containing protein [Thalassovita sp.]
MKLCRMLVSVAGLTVGLANPSMAREITVTTQMAKFAGPRAYVVVYVTDPNGAVYDTLSVAGRKSKYYGHLRGWVRGAKASQTPISAVTGASVGSGKTLRTTVEIADALLAQGYQVRVDASVEDRGDYPKAAVLTLGAPAKTKGRGVVHSVSVD